MLRWFDGGRCRGSRISVFFCLVAIYCTHQLTVLQTDLLDAGKVEFQTLTGDTGPQTDVASTIPRAEELDVAAGLDIVPPMATTSVEGKDGLLRQERTTMLPQSQTRNPGLKLKNATTTTTLIPRLTEGWWTPYVNTSSRVFPKWKGLPHEWCILQDPKHTNTEKVPDGQKVNGLLYVKSHKASSSTCEGINNAIAYHVAERIIEMNGSAPNNNNNMKVCRHYNAHDFADSKQHSRREHPSLLWSFVRHPQARDVSDFFHFRVSREGGSPEDIDLFRKTVLPLRGRQGRYLNPSRTKRLYADHVRERPQVAAKTIAQVLNAYDFLGVTERMDESLAVMTFLFDLDPTDVVVLSAKQSGGYDGVCIKLQKAYLTEETRSLLLSDEYVLGNSDFLLYAAVNSSLDRTIAELGVELVHDRARLIRQLQKLVLEQCRDKVIFRCSETGEKQYELAKPNCYTHDAGCGYPCVDQVMDAYRKNQIKLPNLPAVS